MANSLHSYLIEIGKIPLLRQEEELMYGKQIQAMISLDKAREDLARELGIQINDDILSKQISISVPQIIHTISVGKRAKEIFVKANLRLVVSISKKYLKRSMEMELLDLIQEGNLGLDRAVDKFDPTLGYRFSTYAYWWIRQAISRSIVEKGRSVRVPTYLAEKANTLRVAAVAIEQELGRSASVAEIALRVGSEAADVQQITTWMQQPVSINIKVGDRKNETLLDFCECNRIQPEAYVDDRLLQEIVIDSLKLLSVQEKEVIVSRYGLKGCEPLTLREVGENLEISAERVRQIQNRALQKLKSFHSERNNFSIFN
jgi:RNA polymerase nonessential primary-like sigma factor